MAPAARSHSTAATVSPTSSITASACSWLTVSGSKPVRAAGLVAGVRPAAGDHGAQREHHREDADDRRTSQVQLPPSGPGGAGGRGPSGRAARQASATVTAMIAIESRKWAATVHGLSPVSTVTPPSTAWAGMPRKAATASGTSDRRPCRSTATRVASATSPTTKVSIRLPNSIAPCSAYSAVGVYDSSVQLGQVGQPSPEPVSRTTPPVTTIAELAITEATYRAGGSPASRTGRGCAHLNG